MELKEMLRIRAGEIGTQLDDAALSALWTFKDFLKEYNQKVNLTAITDDEEIVTKHFLDCLTILPYIEKDAKVIDVGTGPGFPGLVLKIARPDLHLTLLDARNKKVKFLQEAAELLGLDGLDCIHGRAEDLHKQNGYFEGFDCAVSRAVGAMEILSGWCLPFVKKGGRFIAMKGPNYEDELGAAQEVLKKLKAEVKEIAQLTLPNTDINRSIIIIQK